MIDFLKELNEEQRNAAVHTEGPVMIIAGAGSGKTRTLTYRIAYLIKKGVDPFNILALTFTNKAAREMKERILKLIGSSEGRNVWMGTFHSIFARILRAEAEYLGFPANFTIYDTDDSKNLIKSIIKEQNLDVKFYPPSYVLHRISSAKSNLISDIDYNNNNELIEQDKFTKKPLLGLIYTLYNNRLRKASAMDFDDLLFNTNILLRDFPEILYKYQNRFKYILVDEYQDTNFAQYLIIKKLSANNENICVVGDDAQSIYAFRGANIQNILNFKSDYPDVKVFKLEQNYRSTKVIVNAANSVIYNNKDQIFKEIWTDNETGKKIKLIKAANENEEGTLVASSIFEIKMNNQAPESSFAVLYRTNAQSRAIEEALRKLNIPYRIYGGLSFYKRKEIKDLLAYFRLVINFNDEEALMRIINYPTRGIGQTTIDKLRISANTHGMTIWRVMEGIDYLKIDLNSGIKEKIRNFVNSIKSYNSLLYSKNAYELADYIAYTTGLIRVLKEDESPEGISRYENIQELLNAILDFTSNEEETEAVSVNNEKKFKTLDMFMQDVALLTDADETDKDKNTNKVSLMTVHAAKGLEFPYVFVVGLEENLFPSFMSLNKRIDLEEERRLFYVAVTRAEKLLTLSYAENRYRFGDLLFSEPSRFISEINPEYIDFPVKNMSKRNLFDEDKFISKSPKVTPEFKLKKIEPQAEHLNNEGIYDDIDSIQTGMKVHHDRFGVGKVLQVEGAGASKKATVFFENIGNKQLLLKFARLKIVG